MHRNRWMEQPQSAASQPPQRSGCIGPVSGPLQETVAMEMSAKMAASQGQMQCEHKLFLTTISFYY